MNSKSLLTTVFRNLQCARRNRGYWPTMYMMFDAMIALLSLPFFCSHNPSKSLMTVTRNRFSSSSCMEPEIDPIAQQRVFKFFQDHSLPLTWLASFSVMICKMAKPEEVLVVENDQGEV